MSKQVTIYPGDCVDVCPCCLGRVIVSPAAGTAPMLKHGIDRLSGEPCPRDGWPVQDAVLWNYGTADAELASVYDFPEHFDVQTIRREINNPYLSGRR